MNKNKKLIIFGKGELAELSNYYFTNDSDYEVVAFTLDKEYMDSDSYLGLPIVPFDDIENNFSVEEFEIFIAIGYSKLNEI